MESTEKYEIRVQERAFFVLYGLRFRVSVASLGDSLSAVFPHCWGCLSGCTVGSLYSPFALHHRSANGYMKGCAPHGLEYMSARRWDSNPRPGI